jgi:hypothetical protein
LPCSKDDYSLCPIQHFIGTKLMHFWTFFRLMKKRSRQPDNYITHLTLKAHSAAAWNFSKDIHISIYIYMLYTTMNQKYILWQRKQHACAAQPIMGLYPMPVTFSSYPYTLLPLHHIIFFVWSCSKGFPSRFLHELPTQTKCSTHLTLSTSIL